MACVKNYISAIKLWDLNIDISRYNLYLMPLAYVDEKITVDAIVTEDNENYISFVKLLLESDQEDDRDFDIAISIDIEFKKGNSFDAIGVKFDSDGTAVALTEEQIHNRFPWSHGEVERRCRERYSDFKRDKKFFSLLTGIKSNPKLCYSRRLYMDNPKSNVAYNYSPNVLKVFDDQYTKKLKQVVK